MGEWTAKPTNRYLLRDTQLVEWIKRMPKEQFLNGSMNLQCLVPMWFFWICSWLISGHSHRKHQLWRESQKECQQAPAGWDCACVPTGLSRRSVCRQPPIPRERSLPPQVRTPTRCGGRNQSTTESIILDKDVTEPGVGVGQKMAFNLEISFDFWGALQPVFTLLILVWWL